MNDTAPRSSHVLPWLLAALGVALVGVTAWKMHFPAEGLRERTETELVSIIARRTVPAGADVTVSRVWDVTELVVRGVPERHDQNALILALARVQMAEEWRPIQIEFAPPEGDVGENPRVAILQDGQLLD